jgi:hypothetical protein
VVSIECFLAVSRRSHNTLHNWPIATSKVDPSIRQELRHKPHIVHIKNAISIGIAYFLHAPAVSCKRRCS